MTLPFLSHLSPALRNRLRFLLAGNLILLAFIYAHTLSNEKASFLDELSRFGPNVAPLILAALGLTGIVYTGAIDLSVGAIIVVAGTVFGILYEYEFAPAVCFAACYATALCLSMWNACLIRWLKIPAIIVTLAGLTFYRGLALALANVSLEKFSGQISIQGDAYHRPGNEWAGSILLFAIVIAIVWESFGKTPRLWLAHGSSQAACRLQGLDPARLLTGAFFVSGLFLGLAALTETTRGLTIEPNRLARGFELQVVAAVVMGGTNIFGGEGSYLGTILGGAFLYLVGQAMLYAGLSEYSRHAVHGALIIGVIGFDCLMHRKAKLLEELR